MTTPLINVKNLGKDFKDPDDKAYGDKLPTVNKGVMGISRAISNVSRNTKGRALDALKRVSDKLNGRVSYQKDPSTDPMMARQSLVKDNELAKLKPREVQLKVIKSKLQAPVKKRMKQYGDKGYRPSDGTGVGH